MIWGESDNTDIVDTDGTVTAPTDQDTAVKIPLSFEVDGQAQNVELNVTVKQNSDPDANQGELVAAYNMTREAISFWMSPARTTMQNYATWKTRIS